jgi:hypothetical protein
VSKRTLVFAVLASIFWSTIATASAGYYYMQCTTYSDQLYDRQQLLDELAEKYDLSVSKWNLLAGDYGSLRGDYQWLSWEENYPTFMRQYGVLISNLKGNYSDLLKNYYELNESYNLLCNNYTELGEQDFIAKEEFSKLLEEYYELFTSMSMKELDESIAEATTLKVNLCINYSSTTIVWHNGTLMPLGSTLLDVTQAIATVEKDYWATMEPGHVTIESINGWKQQYWLWYYWNQETNAWVIGPVGCDAWMLRDGGVYKWHCF